MWAFARAARNAGRAAHLDDSVVVGVGLGSVARGIRAQSVFKSPSSSWRRSSRRACCSARQMAARRRTAGKTGMIAYGLGIGLAGSLMGVSGGSMSTMVLTLYGKPIMRRSAPRRGWRALTIAGPPATCWPGCRTRR